MKKIIFLFFVCFLFSCQNSENTPPPSETSESWSVLEEENTFSDTTTTPKEDFIKNPPTSWEDLSQDTMEDEQNASDTSVPKTIGGEEDPVFLDLPIDQTTYGKPIMTGVDSFTYSKINGFEVKKVDNISELSCETITEYLGEIYNWFYWNTCRPLTSDAFYVNVVSLSGVGDTWSYEVSRLYFDKKYNFFGSMHLDEGTGKTSDDLPALNDELKNKEYEITNMSDKLFYDIVK